MTARGTVRRRIACGASLLAALVLTACAGGSPRPQPAELPANIALIGVRQAWTARLPAIVITCRSSLQPISRPPRRPSSNP